MSKSMYRRHLTQVGVVAGADSVFTWCPIPARSSLDVVHMDFQIKGDTQPTKGQGCIYAIDGYILEIPDPDGSTALADPNDLWDKMVPKEAEYGAELDYDSDDTADAGPTVGSPDEINITRLFGGYNPKRIFDRLRLLFASMPLSQPATSSTWQPFDRVKTSLTPKIWVERPSVAMFAIHAPDLSAAYDAFIDGTNDRQDWIPTSKLEWAALQYSAEVAKQWLWQTVGIAEGVNATLINAVRRWLEQAYIEDDGRVIDQTYEIMGQATYQVTPGGLIVPTLTSRP